MCARCGLSRLGPDPSPSTIPNPDSSLDPDCCLDFNPDPQGLPGRAGSKGEKGELVSSCFLPPRGEVQRAVLWWQTEGT